MHFLNITNFLNLLQTYHFSNYFINVLQTLTYNLLMNVSEAFKNIKLRL
jgi:hypothetical protein